MQYPLTYSRKLTVSQGYFSPGGLRVDHKCARCGGAGYRDEDGDWACLMCGRALVTPNRQASVPVVPVAVKRARANGGNGRQSAPIPMSSDYSDGALIMNPRTYGVSFRGRSLKLRPIEFQLLSFLCRQRGVAPQERILETVWGLGRGSLNSLKWHIRSLREKLEEDPGSPQVLLTVRRVGYQYLPPEPATRVAVRRTG